MSAYQTLAFVFQACGAWLRAGAGGAGGSWFPAAITAAWHRVGPQYLLDTQQGHMADASKY